MGITGQWHNSDMSESLSGFFSHIQTLAAFVVSYYRITVSRNISNAENVIVKSNSNDFQMLPLHLSFLVRIVLKLLDLFT